MVWKKVIRISKNIFGMGRDVAVNQALINAHINWGVTIYSVISANPLEIALSVLAVKLGVTNKIILTLIVAFLL